MRNIPATTHQMDPPGIGPKKTFFVLMTVVGCIAILWPKVFYPMMLGGGIPKQPAIKGHHGTVACCDVVLDRDNFLNISKTLGDQAYRKQIDYRIAQMSLRQERPPHLRKEGIHPAMLEKGRAIPSTQTVPVVSRPAKSQPIMVEGRPGPIPGLRPPLGAGAVHKAQPKSTSMSFIMPLYTIGIIAFFVYTIMKLLFKKQVTNAPYGPARGDPNFRKEVFEDDQLPINRPDDGTTKLAWKDHETRSNYQQMHATCNCDPMHVDSGAAVQSPTSASNQTQQHQHRLKQQLISKNGKVPENASHQHHSNGKVVREQRELMEIEKLRKKLEDTEQAMAKLIAEMGCDPYKAKDQTENTSSAPSNLANGHTKSETNGNLELSAEDELEKCQEAAEIVEKSKDSAESEVEATDKKDDEIESKGHVETCKPDHSQKRTAQPIEDEAEKPESIFLEGALPRESQILVADAETRTENVIDDQLNGSPDEPAVVLSSKMTLSLINLNAGEEPDHTGTSTESDSPIGEDIEIINGAEKDSNDTDEPEERHENEKAKKSHE